MQKTLRILPLVVFCANAAVAAAPPAKDDAAHKVHEAYVAAVAAAEGTAMDADKVKDLATRYTSAWCSQDPARVASFYSEKGSLTINAGEPAVGRDAITASAQGFMSAFPDMVVAMDSVGVENGQLIFRWTLSGTNTGPGGTGKPVRMSGYEEWTLAADGLIAQSLGHYDEADYARQLGR
jgi:uncharacterized protein (TIGR02246 family)